MSQGLGLIPLGVDNQHARARLERSSVNGRPVQILVGVHAQFRLHLGQSLFGLLVGQNVLSHVGHDLRLMGRIEVDVN